MRKQPIRQRADAQFDLFESRPSEAVIRGSADAGPPVVDVTALDDEALIAGLDGPGIAYRAALAEEIGRRRLSAGVPALKILCQRHAGYGGSAVLREVRSALAALGAVGGEEAASALADLLARRVIGGAALEPALEAANRLRLSLPEELAEQCLRHDSLAIRRAAARNPYLGVKSITLLVELLEDLHLDVRMAAACALGRLGRKEGRSILLDVLRTEPTEEVVSAIAEIADEECIVLLGRVGTLHVELTALILDVLDALDGPCAAKVAAKLR